MKKILLPDLNATEKFGQSLAQSIEKQALIALSGEMGSGKTTLVKALARGLAIDQMVNSPTFVIMNEYHGGRLALYHLDLYRFGAAIPTGVAVTYDLSFLAAEVDELSSSDGVVIIEWPEYFVFNGQGSRSEFFAERDHLKINLEYARDNPDARVASVSAAGPAHSKLVNILFNLAKDMLIYW